MRRGAEDGGGGTAGNVAGGGGPRPTGGRRGERGEGLGGAGVAARFEGRAARGGGWRLVLLAQDFVGQQDGFEAWVVFEDRGPGGARDGGGVAGGAVAVGGAVVRRGGGKEGSRAALGKVVEEAGDVVAVLADAFAEPLDFGGFVVDFAASLEQVTVQGGDELVQARVFVLQLRALRRHVVEQGVRVVRVGRGGLLGAREFVFAALFGGLEHVDFAVGHVELDGHPVLRLPALHLEHVELQLVMGGRRPGLAER